ncbi:uncharacterized protein LOC111043268 isoform X1 [Nilaparvata lugens]|uniref:uncharacterized protein LOC111043268 isoform X1 n=2 Tax=Nilaparvata lugens TaxID=108931 RepID=UPI00193CE47C|nr:uncharacterized protein LOC111043268 isoform X1 [Nilaparvata lugens]
MTSTMKHVFIIFTGFSQILATGTRGNSLSINKNLTFTGELSIETLTDMDRRKLSIEKSSLVNEELLDTNLTFFPKEELRNNWEIRTSHSHTSTILHGYPMNPRSEEQPSTEAAFNEFENNCNFKTGMYYDICGKCVNKTAYANECKICGGSINCQSCSNTPDTKPDQCGQCLKLEDNSWNNCTKTFSMFPTVIDITAVDKHGIVYLKGVGLSGGSLPNLECSIHNSFDNKFLNVINILLVKNKIQITFEMNGVEHEYQVHCNTSNEDAVIGFYNLTIINSNSLSILMLAPSSVVLGREVEFLVIARGMSTLSDIICFIKAKNNALLTTLPTDNIQGNSLVTNITCPLYTPKCADNFVFGIAYTYEAIAKLGNSNTKKLEVKVSAPYLKSKYFSSDLRQVVFEFNDIIEGPSNCAHLFIPMTLHLLGNQPVCHYSANILRIVLGQQASLKSMKDIKFIPGQIRSVCGSLTNAPAFSGSTLVESTTDTGVLLNKPVYKLIGPSEICVVDGSFNTHYLLALMDRKMSHYEYLTSSSTTQFVVHSLGSEEIQYKWTLRYYFETDVEGGGRQRRNLLVWLSVRELEKILKTVTKSEVIIDNSLLVPKVKYVLSVIGQNRIGESGESLNITFQLSTSPNRSLSKDHLELTIIGSPVLNPGTDNWFEAIIASSCYDDELNNTYKFSWMIDKIGDFPTQRGPKLFLPVGILKSNSSYTITCEVQLNNQAISKNSYNFRTTVPKFKITIGISDIVFGTGQTLQLWSAITDSTHDTRNRFEYIWSCSYNRVNECFLPLSNSTRLEDIFKSEFRKKILTLKSGSLMVGVYTFRVSATLKETNDTIVSPPTRVRIVEGEPPLVSIEKYPIFTVNPREDFNIVAKVSRLYPGCRLSWDFLRAIGSSYIELNSLINGTNFFVPLDSNIRVKEFPLIIPGKLPGCMEENNCNLLQENTFYTLELIVSCSAKVHSYVTTKFQTGSLPRIYNLEVKPHAGVGSVTEFQFTTDTAYSSQEYQPLEYSFGFKISGEKTLYFYTSSNWLNHKTVLPSLSDKLESPTTIETILKVCNNQGICVSRLGPPVLTTNPKNVSLQMLNSLRYSYSSYLRNENYNEAFSLAYGFFKTFKSAGNQLSYQNLSQIIESEIMRQIATVTGYLEKDSNYNMKSAVALIESVTATVQYLIHSEILLGNLVSFKKKVLQILKESNRSTVEVRSLFSESNYRKKFLSKKHMKSESLFWKARIQREISVLPQSREEVLTLDTVKTMLEASEVAILNFTEQESAVSEVRELLQNVDYYVSSLCDQTFNDGKLIYIGTKVAELSVKRIHLDVSCTEEMPLPDCKTQCFSSKAYIKLGEKLANTFPDNDNICYASLIYPSDYLSTVYSGNILNNDLRLSNVYSVKLMTQYYSEPKTEEEVYYVEMKIPIKNFVFGNGFTLKCFVWIMERREWIPDLCQSHFVEDSSRYIRCECPVNHYISVFAVNDTNEFGESTEFDSLLEEEQNLNHVTAISESMHQSSTKPDWELVSLAYHRITFRIDEDYETVVGSKREEFIGSVKNQLVEKFLIPSDMFKNVTVYPGTVMVSMQLVNSTSVSVSDILPTLVRALNFGDLTLSGINGQPLNIPPQLLQISEKLIGVDNDSSEALLVVLIGFLICIAVFTSFTIAAIILKRKNDKLTDDETEETANDLNFPKYRELYFEQSIDGSEATLNQYRRPVQVQFQPDSNGEDSGISIIPELARHCATENGAIASSNVHCNVIERSFLPGSSAENM